MKKIILTLSAIAALSFAGSAGAAKIYDPGCGKNFSGYGASPRNLERFSDGWRTNWAQTCAAGPYSVEVEIQKSSDGGDTWQTVTANGVLLNFIYATTTAEGGNPVLKGSSSYAPGCNPGWLYREKVWDYNSGLASNGSGNFC